MSQLGRATAIMTIGTVFSRVTGLIRIAAIAAALGIAESRLPDTYNLANTAPNIIYELVLGGVVTSVFVPVFVELLEKEGRERAWEVASAMINLAVTTLVVLTIVGIVAAPWIASLYASRLEGADAVQQEQVLTFLLRLFIPQIIFYGLAAITAGLLNAHKKFGPPMFTPVLNNLTVIAVFIVFAQSYGAVGLENVTTAQQLIIGLGTTAGVAIMAFAQLPFLRGLGRYRLTFSLSHPSVRKLGRLSIFVIGYVVSNQLGYFVVQALANGQQGGYSAYVNAFTFFMLPHGLFAVSVITALLPGMSGAAVNRRWDEFRQRLSSGVRATTLLVLPAAVGYLVLGERIVRYLLERGVMTATSTELVTGVLRFFVLGLLPFSIFQLFLRAFYALQDTKTPFLINVGAVILNAAINIPMFKLMGVKGLAAGHAISYVFGVSLQARVLSRRVGGLGGREILGSLARIAGATAVMGAFVFGASELMDSVLGGRDFLSQTAGLLVPVLTGVLVYLGAAQALGVKELSMVKGLIARKRTGAPDEAR